MLLLKSGASGMHTHAYLDPVGGTARSIGPWSTAVCTVASETPCCRLSLHAAISAQFEAMTTDDPPGKGKSKVVSTPHSAPCAWPCRSRHLSGATHCPAAAERLSECSRVAAEGCHRPHPHLAVCAYACLCVQYPLELTLEEVYHGCLKKVTHKRKVLVNPAEYYEEERALTVDVKPGLPTGTRFVFEG